MKQISAENPGNGLAPPSGVYFPWDVSALSLNVWDVDRLVRQLGSQKINIVETSEDSLTGSYQMKDDLIPKYLPPSTFGGRWSLNSPVSALGWMVSESDE